MTNCPAIDRYCKREAQRLFSDGLAELVELALAMLLTRVLADELVLEMLADELALAPDRYCMSEVQRL